MKMIYGISFLIALLLTGCIKNDTPIVTLNQVADSSAMVIYSGRFSNGPYGSVSGDARIYRQDSLYKLALENLSSSNGPDLHVYLSKEVQPVNYIDLGRLQSTMGNQVYPIPGNPDLTQYRYALVHCQRFNHLFGSAGLR